MLPQVDGPCESGSPAFFLDQETCGAGRTDTVYLNTSRHLNPLGLFLRTSILFIWRILSACLPY